MLFKDEQIEFDESTITQAFFNDELINDKYLRGEVRIVTEQARYPLDTINIMIDSGKYELNPDFQRRRRWNNAKKSKLIESFIMNVPIPPIFLYENEFSHYEVMDGLQRLTTIYDFYNNSFELCELQFWPELNCRNYKSLPERIKQGIDRRYISSIILLQESAKDSEEAQKMKQLVFERINSGGVKLEGQETRNALYNGPMNKLCIDLSRNKYLCAMFDIPNIDLNDQQTMDIIKQENLIENELLENEIYKKMDDVEYVLRFFAMRQIDGYSNRSLNEFLDIYLRRANSFNPGLLKRLEELFNDTIKLIYDLFGEAAFYMWRRRGTRDGVSWNWFARATTTIYDPLMYAVSNLLEHKSKFIAQKRDLQEGLKNLYEQNYSVFEGRSNNKSDIEKRREIFLKFFKRFIKGEKNESRT